MIFFQNTPELIFENTNPSIPNKPLDEIAELETNLNSQMGKDLRVPKGVMDSFKIKDSLNPEIWPNGKLEEKIRTHLIKIAKDFINDVGLKGIKVYDIVFMGSLANYNWSKFSDIDLHILVNLEEFDGDPKMIANYFNAYGELWNQEHKITVHGYPVEIYVQDIHTIGSASSVFSLLRKRWVKKPTRENFKINAKDIKDKANKFIYKLKDIRQDYQDKQYQSVVDKVTDLKGKIKRMRNSGLEGGGEYSQENLVFKTLRRTPFMDILDNFKAKAYDSLMSVMETNETMLDEGEVLKKTKFEIKPATDLADEIVINAMYEGQRIASISFIPLENAYWKFNGEMSEEKYNQIFPSDEFVEIIYLKVYFSNFRGEGLAKKLMAMAIKETKKMGYKTMYLNAKPMDIQGLNLQDLVGFYESFGFKPFMHQGGNVQMVNYFGKKLNETKELPMNAVIFILGEKLQDNTQRLFVTLAKNIIVLDRKKTDNELGQSAKMANFGNNQVYRVGLVDGKLKARGVAWGDNTTMLTKLGLSNNSVVLNNNKTPIHWASLKFNSIGKAINMLSSNLRNIPNVRWEN